MWGTFLTWCPKKSDLLKNVATANFSPLFARPILKKLLFFWRSKLLKASFANDITKWPKGNYTTLLLEQNFIGRVTPFPALNLTTISFRSNEIEAIDPKAFYNLPKLRNLDLSKNHLTEQVLIQEVFEVSFQWHVCLRGYIKVVGSGVSACKKIGWPDANKWLPIQEG